MSDLFWKRWTKEYLTQLQEQPEVDKGQAQLHSWGRCTHSGWICTP